MHVRKAPRQLFFIRSWAENPIVGTDYDRSQGPCGIVKEKGKGERSESILYRREEDGERLVVELR
jgi:hypothetical protein